MVAQIAWNNIRMIAMFPVIPWKVVANSDPERMLIAVVPMVSAEKPIQKKVVCHHFSLC